MREALNVKITLILICIAMRLLTEKQLYGYNEYVSIGKSVECKARHGKAKQTNSMANVK